VFFVLHHTYGHRDHHTGPRCIRRLLNAHRDCRCRCGMVESSVLPTDQPLITGTPSGLYSNSCPRLRTTFPRAYMRCLYLHLDHSVVFSLPFGIGTITSSIIPRNQHSRIPSRTVAYHHILGIGEGPEFQMGASEMVVREPSRMD